jgi:hypothetical protein
MSFLGRLLRGAMKSSTVQVNGGFLGILLMLMQSDAFNGIISKNPEYAAIALGVQSLLNIILRAKTKKPLTERADD